MMNKFDLYYLNKLLYILNRFDIHMTEYCEGCSRYHDLDHDSIEGYFLRRKNVK